MSKDIYEKDKRVPFSINGEAFSALISSGERTNDRILEILSESNPSWENVIIQNVTGESDGYEDNSED